MRTEIKIMFIDNVDAVLVVIILGCSVILVSNIISGISSVI